MSAATGVSASTIGRIWRSYGLKPHLHTTFKLSNDRRFAEKLEDVVGLYLNPPDHVRGLVLNNDYLADTTSDGTSAFSAPGRVDLEIGSCSSAEGIRMSIQAVAFPPPSGIYEVSPDLNTSAAGASATINGQEWSAGWFDMSRHCGGNPVFGLPACTPTSPGAGSVTVSSASAEDVSGSYSFTMVQFGAPRLTPPTKLVQGTFDLEFRQGVSCG